MINILPLFFLSAWTISIVVNSSNSSTRRFPRTPDSTSRRSKNAGKCGFDYVNPNTFGWNALFRDNETPLFLCIFDRFLWNYLIKGLRPYKSYRIWKKNWSYGTYQNINYFFLCHFSSQTHLAGSINSSCLWCWYIKLLDPAELIVSAQH